MTTRAPAVLTISKRNRKVQIYVVVSSWSLQLAPILLLGRIRFDFDRSSSWWQNLGNSTQNNMLNLLLLCENHGFPSSKCPFRLWYVCRLHLIHFDKQTDWQTCRACAKEILTLFWWDLLCNRTLSHFLGRTSKKTTLYIGLLNSTLFQVNYFLIYWTLTSIADWRFGLWCSRCVLKKWFEFSSWKSTFIEV